ncbi:MAG TPA: DUF5131 family protein, partial [Candidatus Acidoferrum sp.]|nr:DUF5131 family protein [Candidatus Acidoferrum sp.]
RRRCDLAAKNILIGGELPLGFDVDPWPLPNVHLGVSAEDQDNLEARWAELRRCPAAVRWISAEPLLGPISGRGVVAPRELVDGFREVQTRYPTPLPTPPHLGAPGIDWLVVGGESGRRARPFDLAWGRSIIEQGRTAGVPVFMKQLGRRPFVTEAPCGAPECANFCPHAVKAISLKDSHGGDPDEWPLDLRVRQWPEPSHAR